MLKALNEERVLWLTRAFQVAWKLIKTTKDWQTSVVIPMHKKDNLKECTNYRGISGKVHAKRLERKCRKIVESELEDGQ